MPSNFVFTLATLMHNSPWQADKVADTLGFYSYSCDMVGNVERDSLK